MSLRKFIFWEYRRGSWQYDLMVGLILAFIFLTPREIFRDYPRASSVVMLPGSQFWIEPALLYGLEDSQKLERANELLRNRTGKFYRVSRLEPIFDSEQEIKGYMAYATE
ncbi:MAG: hypothetical protein NZV14_17630 [Bryobacteraceae bacterium]|nr:hypothetical protein [Bryobacteraceae bacterium]MDW8379984.1 hypothetical protein [Bryobacterales bacterium]